MMATERPVHVPESRFGKWFLRTEIWETRVLDVALGDLDRLLRPRPDSYPVIVDVGCGAGQSFRRLHARFSPDRIIGVDIDPEMLLLSATEVSRIDVPVSLIRGTSASIGLATQSVDMLFCHQTFHHLPDQDAAIAEFHRVLKPGGVLLFAESTKAFIHSWIIRLLFRHPMDVQKSSMEYLDLIENAGFRVTSEAISHPYLWWSRADLGVREKLWGTGRAGTHDETLINVVAIR